MKWMFGHKQLGVISGALGALFVAPCALAGGRTAHQTGTPVSLAVGTVRTPEFSPPTHWYWIIGSGEEAASVAANGMYDGHHCGAARIQGLHQR